MTKPPPGLPCSLQKDNGSDHKSGPKISVSKTLRKKTGGGAGDPPAPRHSGSSGRTRIGLFPDYCDKLAARSGTGIDSRVSHGKMLVERGDAPIDLFRCHNQGRCNDEMRDPRLNRDAFGKYLRRNLIDQ